MARCKNPACGKICRIPAAINWKKWQLCYSCARELHPEFYEGKRKHGVGGTYLNEAPAESMMEKTIKINNV